MLIIYTQVIDVHKSSTLYSVSSESSNSNFGYTLGGLTFANDNKCFIFLKTLYKA